MGNQILSAEEGTEAGESGLLKSPGGQRSESIRSGPVLPGPDTLVLHWLHFLPALSPSSVGK